MRSPLFIPLMGIAIVSSMAMAAQPNDLEALSGLERGEWELHERGNPGPAPRLCISDPSQFLQLRHLNNQCSRFVVSKTSERVSVTYDCARAGQGRTDVRVETSRLVQISSQGVSNGTPFSVMIEGRRVGACRAAIKPH